QPLELIAHRGEGTGQALVDGDLLIDALHARVKSRLSPQELLPATLIYRGDQRDVRHAMAELRHGFVRGDQRCRPERIDPQPASRMTLDPVDPELVGAAERMAGAVGARITQHSDARLRALA